MLILAAVLTFAVAGVGEWLHRIYHVRSTAARCVELCREVAAAAKDDEAREAALRCADRIADVYDHNRKGGGDDNIDGGNLVAVGGPST